MKLKLYQLILMLILLPLSLLASKPVLKTPKIYIIGNELLVILQLKDGLDLDRLAIIEKGIPVRLTYNFSIYEKNILFFDEQINYNLFGDNSLEELNVTLLLSFDYISKKYKIKIKKNFTNEVETKYLYSGSNVRDSYNKLKKYYFDKKIKLYLDLKKFNIKKNNQYYISASAEFIAVKPFDLPFRIPNPFNFKTNTIDSQAVKYVEDE